MKMKPIGDHVLIQEKERADKTESGIILPDTVSEQAQTAQGIVISVGQGSRNMTTGDYMEIPIEVGDTIVYTKFSATEIQHEGEEFFVVAERDIVAVVEEKA